MRIVESIKFKIKGSKVEITLPPNGKDNAAQLADLVITNRLSNNSVTKVINNNTIEIDTFSLVSYAIRNLF